MKIGSLLWLLLFSAIVQSNSYAPISIMNYYASADVVALVRIQSGELIEGSDIPCGAKYQAIVIHPLKKTRLDQTISFGYHYGIEIGSEYLVFLEKKRLSQWPKISTLSDYEKYQAQFDRQCQSRHPDYNLIRRGETIYKLEYHPRLKGDFGFQITTDFTTIPQGAKPQNLKNGQCYPWDCVWVSKKDMFNLFEFQELDNK